MNAIKKLIDPVFVETAILKYGKPIVIFAIRNGLEQLEKYERQLVAVKYESFNNTTNDYQKTAFIEENNSLKKQLERKIKEKDDESQRYDKCYEKLRNIRGEYDGKIEKLKTKFDEKLSSKDLKFEEFTNNMFCEIERRVNEQIKNLNEKNLILNEKLDHEREEKEKVIQKKEELEKKYKLSATKGIEFEKDIFNSLQKINEEIFGTIWKIYHVGQSCGGKGDIIMEHSITEIRFMIDPKNHNNVGKVDKEKFLKDMRNTLNSFNVGIMLSRGKIRGFKCYDEVSEGEKLYVYMSNYKVGDELWLMTKIEQMHNDIRKKLNDKQFDIKTLQPKLLKRYNEKVKLEKQGHTIANQARQEIIEISNDYSEYGFGDIEIDSKEISRTKLDISDFIFKYLNENIEITNNKKDCIKISEIFAKIAEIIPDPTAKRVTQCVNKWKLDNHKDKKKVSSKGKICGYVFKKTL